MQKEKQFVLYSKMPLVMMVVAELPVTCGKGRRVLPLMCPLIW